MYEPGMRYEILLGRAMSALKRIERGQVLRHKKDQCDCPKCIATDAISEIEAEMKRVFQETLVK